jgi:hypothetical protein
MRYADEIAILRNVTYSITYSEVLHTAVAIASSGAVRQDFPSNQTKLQGYLNLKKRYQGPYGASSFWQNRTSVLSKSNT